MVYILLGAGFEESEALVPADLLRRAGIETRLAGVDALQVTGGHGITITADCLLSDVVILDGAEMLLLPGGLGGVRAIQGSPAALSLIRSAAERGLWLAAICAAPTILAGLGLLDSRRAVCYPGMEDEMGAALADQSAPVVIDGNFITAQAAGSSFPFALALVEALRGPAAAGRLPSAVHYHR